MSKVRWGIVGTGRVARNFAADLRHAPEAEIVAVASRDAARAEAFARDVGGAARAHGSYEALAADPAVEVAYIATPNSCHRRDALLCIEAGKTVLCEKPFTLNAREAGEVIAAARRRRVFLMEGLWTRFFPAIGQVREWLAAGAIGAPRWVEADLGYRAPYDPASRLFAPELGGGALLDLGIYPLAFAFMVLGAAPAEVRSVAQRCPVGTDAACALLLRYEGGAIATLTAGFAAHTRREAAVYGEGGRIVVHEPFWRPWKVSLVRDGAAPEVREFPVAGRGYQYEIAEVGRLVREGRLESDLVPLDETLALQRLMDGVRAEWGMAYPGE